MVKRSPQPGPVPPRDVPPGFVAGNVYDKYGSRNPIYRRLVGAFLSRCGELLSSIEVGSLLEVGSGAGELWERLAPEVAWSSGARYVGSDVSLDEVEAARRRRRDVVAVGASIYRLPFADASFDCILASEVLEHLEEPSAAVAELARVTRRHVLVSVPWEPVWRGLNVLRGAYLRHLGNTPGHLQHFSRRRIRRLLTSRFAIVAEARPFPWTVLLARARGR